MSLYYQLLKKHTKLEEVKDMNDVFSNILSGRELEMEIWGLKPNEDFPWESEDSKHNYLGFIGLSKMGVRDDIRTVEFYHENKGCEEVMLPFLEILSSKLNLDDKEVNIHAKRVIIVPRNISNNDRDLWTQYLQKYFTNIESGERFIDKHNIKMRNVGNWGELLYTMPKTDMDE